MRQPIRRKPTKPLAKKRGTSTAAKKRKAIQLWGQYVHQRDGCCMRCYRETGKLDAHHIMIRNFAFTAADEGNGVLLCFKCHGLMHSEPMEAVAFYTKLLGLDGYEALRQRAYDGQGKTLRAAHWEEAIDRLQSLLGALDGE